MLAPAAVALFSIGVLQGVSDDAVLDPWVHLINFTMILIIKVKQLSIIWRFIVIIFSFAFCSWHLLRWSSWLRFLLGHFSLPAEHPISHGKTYYFTQWAENSISYLSRLYAHTSQEDRAGFYYLLYFYTFQSLHLSSTLPWFWRGRICPSNRWPGTSKQHCSSTFGEKTGRIFQ